MVEKPRFIVDHMLGRLAKWLRIVGCDTLYWRDAPDSQLRECALRESRVLMTRDRALFASVPSNRRCFVRFQKYPDQIKQVLSQYPELADGAALFTRCLECNGLLYEIRKEQITVPLPKGVLEKQDKFWRCFACGKIYWRASHYDKTAELFFKIRTTPVEGKDRF